MITLPSINQAKRWLLQFIELQLFLTALSLPILISWGLPLSLAGLLGNLIFAPFLTLFLLISSLLFFTEIIGIPNQLFIYLIELIGALWQWLLQCAHHNWLLGFPRAPLWFLCLIGISSVCIVTLLKQHSSLFRSMLLSLLLVASYITTHLFFVTQNRLFFIECHTKQVIGLYADKQLVLIEPGACGRLKSAQSWIDYTCMPAIIKASGATRIDHLIICQPGQRIFETMCALLTKMAVSHLYLIVWDGTLSKKTWASYFKLCSTAKEQGCTITRIGKKAIKIPLRTSDISILPLSNTIEKHECSFHGVQIQHGATILHTTT